MEAWTQLQRLVKHPYNTISGVLILYPVGEAPLQAPLQDGAALLEGCTRQFRKYFIEEINIYLSLGFLSLTIQVPRDKLITLTIELNRIG